MCAVATKQTSSDSLLRLGRISKFPTVWTNVFVGTAMPAGALPDSRIDIFLLSTSRLYGGGVMLMAIMGVATGLSSGALGLVIIVYDAFSRYR
jgi:hypothetical protein